MAHKAFKTLGIAAAFATAISGLSPANDFSIASTAQAQTAPQSNCQPEAVVKERMKQEGQMRLIVGKRTIETWNENVFTSNESGTKGYNLEFGNGQICIAAEYRNIRVADITDPNNRRSVPSWALLNYDPRPVAAECQRAGSDCYDHNESLQRAFRNNQFVSFMAITQRRNADGSLSDTGVISMTTEASARRGSAVDYTNGRGASHALFEMVDTTQTQLAGNLIQRQQLASANAPVVLASLGVR